MSDITQAPVVDPTTPPAAPAAPAPEQPAEASPVAPKYSRGQLVTYTYESVNGPHTQTGMVVEVLPDEGAGIRQRVAWLTVSGPLHEEDLEAFD